MIEEEKRAIQQFAYRKGALKASHLSLLRKGMAEVALQSAKRRFPEDEEAQAVYRAAYEQGVWDVVSDELEKNQVPRYLAGLLLAGSEVGKIPQLLREYVEVLLSFCGLQKRWATLFSPFDFERIRRGVRRKFSLESVAEQGLYHGGESLVERHLPPRMVLLDSDVEEVIAKGVESLAARWIRLLTAEEVGAAALAATRSGVGFALIRLGDGELLTLARGTVLTDAEVQLAGGHFLSKAGVNVAESFESHARERLVQSVLQADIVGVPVYRGATFQGLLHQLIRHFDWPIRQMSLTTSVINYELYEQTDFYRQLCAGRRVLLIGNKMARLGQRLRDSGYEVVSCLPVGGLSAVDKVLEQAQMHDFDVALVAAGVAANVICPALKLRGKIALDFGHLADRMNKLRATF